MNPDGENIKVGVEISINAVFRINFVGLQSYAKPFTLRLPSTLGKEANVEIDFDRTIGSVLLRGIIISHEQFEWLKNSAREVHGNEYPEVFSSTYNVILSELDRLSKLALEYVKFFVGREELADNATSSMRVLEWSEDGSQFYSLPTLLTARGEIRSQISLTPEIISSLQEGIDKGISPFIAMLHLYRAIQESNPRFKWIDATIAAELAVKEALIRKNPALADIIIELPSPPLGTLYGAILEKYCGAQSPQRAKLIKGAEKRNKLVHRPEETVITEGEAQDYVTNVMQAIHHLYSLLYPDWEVVKRLNELPHFLHVDPPKRQKVKKK